MVRHLPSPSSLFYPPFRDEILFVQLVQQEPWLYGLSQGFAPFTSDREIYSALQILKRIGWVIGKGVR